MGTNELNKPHLICIPPAGGTAASFKALREHLTPDWNVAAIDPPGHGANPAPLCDDLEELVAYYLNEFQEALASPHGYALFGYSMGGKIVHRMAQELEGKANDPQAVFISSMYPPDIKPQPISHLSQGLLLRHLVSLGGMSEELMHHEEFLDYFLPIIRADFKAVEEHVSPNPARLRTPLYLFCGLEDERATPDAVLLWKNWAEQVKFHYFDAGHMFLTERAAELAGQLNAVLPRHVIG